MLAAVCSVVLAVTALTGMAYGQDTAVELRLERSTNLNVDWENVLITPEMLKEDGKIHLPPQGSTGFYRLRVETVIVSTVPDGFALVPAGNFAMGNALSAGGEGSYEELPVHTVQVGAFYMAKNLVTKAQWDNVSAWAASHSYNNLGPYANGKADVHPVQNVTWYDVVKWCNARSQMEGLVPCYYTDSAQTLVYKTGNTNINNTMVKWTANGYRLPTEAEWEKAARGGLSGKRYPWGDTITHSQANYFSSTAFSYDVSPTRGYHPTYNDGSWLYTSPVGSFAANGYGLYDMTGNVWEWCWDFWDDLYYSSSPGTDPRGPASGTGRVIRGGSWYDNSNNCRVAFRESYTPAYDGDYYGFRVVRGSAP